MPDSAPNSLVIDARDLVKRYDEGARKALDGVSLQVKTGEMVCILGQSGCGKSTLLGIVGGLDRAFEGQVSLFGLPLAGMKDAPLAALRSKRIGFVFQAFHLLGHLSARDNILAPTLFLRERVDRPARERFEARADDLLEQVGLDGRGDERPSTMSGGERQRLAIARALLMEPELLLCDEPTGNLDMQTGKQVVQILQRLHQSGKTVVSVTHEQQLADAAERIVKLDHGRVVEAP